MFTIFSIRKHIMIGMFLMTIIISLIKGYKDIRRDQVEAAVEYFDHGNFLAVEHEKYEDSLPFYRAAVRLAPNNADYWIGLGNAEAKANVSQSKLASRFNRLKSLAVNQMALNDLSLSWNISIQNSSHNLEDDQLQAIQSYNDICLEEKWDQPFVFRKFLDENSLASIPWHKIENLKTKFGTQQVEFYPQNMIERPSRVFNVPLSEALDFLDYPEGAYVACDISEPGTYMQWNVPNQIFQSLLPTEFSAVDEESKIIKLSLWEELKDKGKFDEEFLINFAHGNTEEEKLMQARFQWQQLAVDKHWNMVLIGEKGAGMFFHTDSLPVGSWQIQLQGSKYWKICPPVSQHDASNVEGATSICAETVLEEGDLLYYPPFFGHTTLCQDSPTISISSTVFHASHQNYYQKMIAMMQQRCRPDTPSVRYAAGVCAWFASSTVAVGEPAHTSIESLSAEHRSSQLHSHEQQQQQPISTHSDDGF